MRMRCSSSYRTLHIISYIDSTGWNMRSVAILAVVLLSVCAYGRDSLRIEQMRAFHTNKDELAPAWIEDGVGKGTFFFERGEALRWDSVGHVMYSVPFSDSTFGDQVLRKRVYETETMRVLTYYAGDTTSEYVPMAPYQNGRRFYSGKASRYAARRGRLDGADITSLQASGSPPRYVPELDQACERINSPYWESHPTCYWDGNLVIFTSDRPGGKGGLDLWCIVRLPTGWSAPINLESLNTEFDDVTPCLANGVLYFSSNRPNGGDSASFDVYYARVSSGTTYSSDARWRDSIAFEEVFPMSAGHSVESINSDADDLFFFARDSLRGCFASNRASRKDFDLYQVTPNPHSPLPLERKSVLALDACTRQPLRKAIGFSVAKSVVNADGYPDWRLIVNQARLDGATGRTVVEWAPDTSVGTYYLQPEPLGEYFSASTVAVRGASVPDTLLFYPIRFSDSCDSILITLTLSFETNSPFLQHNDSAQLSGLVEQVGRLVSQLPQERKLSVSFTGHTDPRPTNYDGILLSPTGARGVRHSVSPPEHERNVKLSIDRAAEVEHYLRDKVPSAQVICETPAGRGSKDSGSIARLPDESNESWWSRCRRVAVCIKSRSAR
jgi:hypothetical protein